MKIVVDALHFALIETKIFNDVNENLSKEIPICEKKFLVTEIRKTTYIWFEIKRSTNNKLKMYESKT